jgi:hypothetical protein
MVLGTPQHGVRDIEEYEMTTLLTIAEAAPQFRKTEGAMRWWLRQDGCPINVIPVGSRKFVSQEAIDAFFAAALKGAA